MTNAAVEVQEEIPKTQEEETKEQLLNDLEFLSDKAMKYARSKGSIKTHQAINQIRQRYGLDKRLL